jgi:hypothetical protein
MAVEGDINSINPNTLSLRKLLDEEREKVTILWVPGHMEIPGNEIVEAKKQRNKNCPGRRPLSHRKIPITRSD